MLRHVEAVAFRFSKCGMSFYFNKFPQAPVAVFGKELKNGTIEMERKGEGSRGGEERNGKGNEEQGKGKRGQRIFPLPPRFEDPGYGSRRRHA